MVLISTHHLQSNRKKKLFVLIKSHSWVSNESEIKKKCVLICFELSRLKVKIMEKKTNKCLAHRKFQLNVKCCGGKIMQKPDLISTRNWFCAKMIHFKQPFLTSPEKKFNIYFATMSIEQISFDFYFCPSINYSEHKSRDWGR